MQRPRQEGRRTSVRTTHVQVDWRCNGAAMQALRLVEQACGCSPRCEAEADRRCVLVSAAGTPVESACRQDHPPRTTHHAGADGLALQRSRHAGSPTGRASLRLLHVVRWRRTEGACSCSSGGTCNARLGHGEVGPSAAPSRPRALHLIPS